MTMCLDIIAEGLLNGILVGPGSPHKVVDAGPCPVLASVCIYNMYIHNMKHMHTYLSYCVLLFTIE